MKLIKIYLIILLIWISRSNIRIRNQTQKASTTKGIEALDNHAEMIKFINDGEKSMFINNYRNLNKDDKKTDEEILSTNSGSFDLLKDLNNDLRITRVQLNENREDNRPSCDNGKTQIEHRSLTVCLKGKVEYAEGDIRVIKEDKWGKHSSNINEYVRGYFINIEVDPCNVKGDVNLTYLGMSKGCTEIFDVSTYMTSYFTIKDETVNKCIEKLSGSDSVQTGLKDVKAIGVAAKEAVKSKMAWLIGHALIAPVHAVPIAGQAVHGAYALAHASSYIWDLIRGSSENCEPVFRTMKSFQTKVNWSQVKSGTITKNYNSYLPTDEALKLKGLPNDFRSLDQLLKTIKCIKASPAVITSVYFANILYNYLENGSHTIKFSDDKKYTIKNAGENCNIVRYS